MENKIGLREFQQDLLAKLQARAEMPATSSMLGVQAGAQLWLLQLDDVSEVVTVPSMTPVPLTQPWFLGAANVRGNLYSIVDFSVFTGGGPIGLGPESRVVLLAQKFAINAGMVVSRMLGLRGLHQFQLNPAARVGQAPWVAAEYLDSQGTAWARLDAGELAKNPAFLDVGR